MKDPSDNFDIIKYFISFANSSTRATSANKLNYNIYHSTTTRHFYFNRISRLWNSAPSPNLRTSLSLIKRDLVTFLWDHFLAHFNPDSLCSIRLVCPCSSCSSQLSATPTSMVLAISNNSHNCYHHQISVLYTVLHYCCKFEMKWNNIYGQTA